MPQGRKPQGKAEAAVSLRAGQKKRVLTARSVLSFSFGGIRTRFVITLAEFYGTSTDYILGRTNQIAPHKR